MINIHRKKIRDGATNLWGNTVRGKWEQTPFVTRPQKGSRQQSVRYSGVRYSDRYRTFKKAETSLLLSSFAEINKIAHLGGFLKAHFLSRCALRLTLKQVLLSKISICFINKSNDLFQKVFLEMELVNDKVKFRAAINIAIFF